MNKFARALAIAALAGATIAGTGCSVMRGQETAGAYVDDTTITTSVKAKFVEDKTVDAASIKVETLNGEVSLSGFAKSPAEKQQAENIARTTGAKVIILNHPRDLHSGFRPFGPERHLARSSSPAIPGHSAARCGACSMMRAAAPSWSRRESNGRRSSRCATWQSVSSTSTRPRSSAAPSPGDRAGPAGSRSLDSRP